MADANSFRIRQSYVQGIREDLKKLANDRASRSSLPTDFKLFKDNLKHKNEFYGDLVLTWNNIHSATEVQQLLPDSRYYSHIENSRTSGHHLILKLDRRIVTKTVIQSTLNEVDIGLCRIWEPCLTLETEDSEISLTQLRRKLVAQVIELVAEKENLNHTLTCQQLNEIQTRVGEVITVGVKLPRANELFEYCLSLVKSASFHKFENSLSDTSDLKLTLMPIVDACIKFNLLLTNPKKTLKIDLQDINERLIKSGSFVMYNYARLATLMDKFCGLVNSGHYPPLPPLNEVDFSLLQRDDEWKLIRDCIMWYPVIDEEIVSSISCESNDITMIPVHKLFHFLLNITHKLSAYYCSVHILGDPLPHLLPTMFARLYLVKTIIEVMRKCFSVLRITPLAQI